MICPILFCRLLMDWFCWMLSKEKRTVYTTQERAVPRQRCSHLSCSSLNIGKWEKFTERRWGGDSLTLSLFKPRPPFMLHMTDATRPGWVGLLHRPSLQLRINCYFTFSGMALAYLGIPTTNKHNYPEWVSKKPQSLELLSLEQFPRTIQWSIRTVFSKTIWNETWHLKKHSPLHKIFPVVHTQCC